MLIRLFSSSKNKRKRSLQSCPKMFLNWMKWIIFWKYESEHDLHSGMNNARSWKRNLKKTQAWLGIEPSPLRRIERSIQPSQRSGFDSWSSFNFFRFLFQPLKLFILLQRSGSLWQNISVSFFMVSNILESTEVKTFSPECNVYNYVLYSICARN